MTDLVERLRATLHELHAIVLGECPSVLDEDRGGSARLAMEIEKLLSEDCSAATALEAKDKELAALRGIICRCASAIGNGAALSPECSIEFMSQLPDEIAAHTDKLKRMLKCSRDEGGEALARAETAERRVTELEKDVELLSDPIAVHINMMRGTIAKPSWENLRHLFPVIYDLEHAEARAETAERDRDEAREAQYLLDWFSKHPKLELSFGGWDEDHDAEWSVHSVGGSRNDREWTLLANRSTPLEAIRAARAITGKD